MSTLIFKFSVSSTHGYNKEMLDKQVEEMYKYGVDSDRNPLIKPDYEYEKKYVYKQSKDGSFIISCEIHKKD